MPGAKEVLVDLDAHHLDRELRVFNLLLESVVVVDSGN
jgi:hypothetical protein